MGIAIPLPANLSSLTSNRMFTCAGCTRQFFEMPPYRRLRKTCSKVCAKRVVRRRGIVRKNGLSHPKKGDLVSRDCAECGSAFSYRHHSHPKRLCSRRCIQRRYANRIRAQTARSSLEGGDEKPWNPRHVHRRLG